MIFFTVRSNTVSISMYKLFTYFDTVILCEARINILGSINIFICRKLLKKKNQDAVYIIIKVYQL